MRARWLKPEFFTDKKIATTDPTTALVYQALWCWADDGGVCICDPDWLKSQAFFRWDAFTLPVISKALRELYDLKMVLIYKVGDDYFAQIRHWKRHQNVHKPAKFRHPRPDEQLTLSSSLLPPSIAGGQPGDSPASPPPRHLDGYSPRRLDGDGAEALARNDAGTVADSNTESTASPPPPPPSEIPPVHIGKTPGARTLALALEADADRLALTALCAVVPAPATWVAEMRGRLEGLNAPGGQPITPRQLAIALTEFVGSGRHLETPPSFRLFKAFLDKAQLGAPSAALPATSPGDANGKHPPTPVSTGEAGAILVKIKAMKGRNAPPGGNIVEFIRRLDVEALGEDVASAFDAIGGGQAILNAEPSRWGLLVRDFASALQHARGN